MARREVPPRTADVADALREGIVRGYLGVRDAVEWAQTRSLDPEVVADPLVSHLARSGHRPASQILLILAQIAWGADAPSVGRIAAHQLRDALVTGRLDARRTAHAIYRLHRDGYAPDAEFERAAARFGDEANGAERSDVAAAGLAPRILAFLDRYVDVPGEPRTQSEPTLVVRHHFTLAAERATAGAVELGAHLAWRGWSGSIMLSVPREALAAFATALRDFSTHHASGAALDEKHLDGGARLVCAASEYGRARRAAVAIHMRDAAPADAHRAPAELNLVVPTEHESVGDFAADLAGIVATGTGVAQLQLLGRWADER